MGMSDFMERKAAASDPVRRVVEGAGAIYHGVQSDFRGGEDFILVTDPVTRSTGMIRVSEVTDETVKAKLAEIRRRFGVREEHA